MASKTLSDGRKVLVGSKADPESKKYLRASGGRSVQLADGTQLTAEQSRDYGKTPTVISSTSITDRIIPELRGKAEKLPGGQMQDQNQVEEPEFDYESLSLTGTKETEDPILKQQMALLDKQKNMLDANARQQITGVQNRVNSLMAEQAAINAANTAGVRGGLMSGGGNAFRYSPQGAFGGVAGQATAGVRALADLASQEANTIAEIKNAQANNDFKLMQDKFDLLETVRAERQAKVAETEAAVSKAQTQNQIVQAIGQGYKDPVSIFQALGGNVPFDSILEVTKTMPEAGEAFTLGSSDIRFAPDGTIIARGSKVGGGSGDVIVGDSLSVGQPVVTVGAPAVAGVGATYDSSSGEAQLLIDDIVNGLPTQLINNVAEIPRWKETVRKQLAAGYTPQQIVDKLSGFRIFDENKKSLGDVFYNLSIGTDLEASKVADLINRGADEQAMTTVENAQLANADGFFTGTDKVRSTVKQADTVLTLLDKVPSDKLGPFDGKVFQIQKKGFLPTLLTPEEKANVVALEQALALLASPIRLEIAGTAATEPEMAKISSFQSGIYDQPDVIKTQVQSLRDSVLGFHNEARQQRGLPTVDKTQVLDNKKRLDLYRGLGKQNDSINMSGVDNSTLLNSILDPSYSPSTSNNTDFWSNLQPQ